MSLAGLPRVPLHSEDHDDLEDGEDHDLEDGDPGDGSGSRRGRPSQATELVDLAAERYQLGQSMSGEPFATTNEGPYVARMLRGGRDSLRAELSAAYVERHDRVPSSSALTDAMLTLQGRPQQVDPVELHLRVAQLRHGDGVVLDLGDNTGGVIVVTPGRWEIVDRSPVLFRRTELTGPLPRPTSEGSLEPLHRLLNVTDESWDLLIAVLVSYLIANIPHPVTHVRGEHGTGKTTIERLLARVIDPSPAQVRSVPRDLDQWSVAASGSWVVPLDNISTIPAWLSDAICRAVTGDGLVKRTLYSDSGLTVLSYRRAIMLTSIDAGSLRGDLADRLVRIDLERIPDHRRMLEADVEAAFTAAHPSILGALLDLLADVLQVLPTVQLSGYPRMADFARVVAAVDRVRGTNALETYEGTRDHLAAEVVEGEPVADAIRRFVEKASWTGTAKELLKAITDDNPDHPKEWPRTPQAMGGAVRRFAPALRAVGLDVATSRKSGTGTRIIELSMTENRDQTRQRGQSNVTNVTDVSTAGQARDIARDNRDDAEPDCHGNGAGQGDCDICDDALLFPLALVVDDWASVPCTSCGRPTSKQDLDGVPLCSTHGGQ